MRFKTLVIAGLGLASIALLGLQLGCSSTQAMKSGYGVPASEGTVDATEGENGNTKLDIRVKHLAEPAQVASDATVYVVWVHPRNAAMQNVGQLTLDDNLEGKLQTLTPHRQFQLTVTPEPGALVAVPTHPAIFTADVDRS